MSSTVVSNKKTTWDNDTNPDYPVRKTVVNGEDVQHVFLENSFKIPSFDYVSASYPSGTQEVYEYKDGGSGGATVGTITINYTDATKANILNVAHT